MVFRGMQTIILEGCTKTPPKGSHAECFLCTCISIFQLHECQYPTSCFVHQSQNREVFCEFSKFKQKYLMRAPEAWATIFKLFYIKNSIRRHHFQIPGGGYKCTPCRRPWESLLKAHQSLPWLFAYIFAKWRLNMANYTVLFFEIWQRLSTFLCCRYIFGLAKWDADACRLQLVLTFLWLWHKIQRTLHMTGVRRCWGRTAWAKRLSCRH